ncbi:MAG: hypothetical protein AAGI23_12070 [Bacteroidota bacterium]
MKYIFFALPIIVACDSSDDSIELNTAPYLFEDGFEVKNDSELSELFPDDNSRWTNLQLVHPESGENTILLDSDIVSEGNHALRIYAQPTATTLSKADIEKSGFRAAEGNTVIIEADFYIASTDDIENLLLIDVECCSCWDNSVPDNPCPGIRIMMKNNDFLSIERGKIGGQTIEQSVQSFPRHEWVTLKWEMMLSPTEEGENRLYINNEEILNELGMNMPNAAIFKAEAASQGIDFKLPSPVFYERLQIGVTANPTSHPVELYVDNVRLALKE